MSPPRLPGIDVLLAALPIDALLGYPAALLRAIGHPVTWIGSLIAFLDRKLNRIEVDPADRRMRGGVALGLVLLATLIAAWLVAWLCRHLPLGWMIEALIVSSLLAQRSLHDHVAAVARALDEGGDDLAAARRAVAQIVGRDPDALDRAGIARAAIESLAENFSDGVVAPAFWLALLGLPGIALYKAINTADSMIGHRTPRHRDFGRAAARLDDGVNWPAARLAALLIVLASFLTTGADARAAWRVARCDARRHRSPNGGWPEAAMAGALGFRLSGPRIYGHATANEPWIGAGNADLDAPDIRCALALYRMACGALWALAALIALVAVLAAR